MVYESLKKEKHAKEIKIKGNLLHGTIKDYHNFNGRTKSLFPETTTNATAGNFFKKPSNPLVVREKVISEFDRHVGLNSNRMINNQLETVRKGNQT